MAKTKSTRSQEEEGEKTKKREKKVSRDAVEKSTKDKKRSRRVVTPPSSDEDVKPDITSGGAPVVEPVSFSLFFFFPDRLHAGSTGVLP